MAAGGLNMVSEIQILNEESCGSQLPGIQSASNLCICVSERNEILVGSENGAFLVNFEGKVINAFLTGQNEDDEQNSVPSVCFCSENENMIYVANEERINAYDSRHNGKKKPVFTFEDCEDDINQIVSRDRHLAACDDSGECRIFDIRSRKNFRTLRNKHTNICSSIAFRPQRNSEILTGGLDCQFILWDYSKLKMLSKVNSQDSFASATGDTSIYMANPPMVNSFDVAVDGIYTVCALGM